jgi:hypothetical protein
MSTSGAMLSEHRSNEVFVMKALALILPVVVTASLLAQERAPSSEMNRLARLFVGSWTTNEQHEPGVIAPGGGFGKGAEKVALGPGGRSLVADYESVDPSGKFLSHGIMWWDATKQAYRGVECYNRSRAGCEMGLWRWEGKNLVSREQGIKEVWTDFTPTSHTFQMDASDDGGPMKRVMTIRYTKTRAAGP